MKNLQSFGIFVTLTILISSFNGYSQFIDAVQSEVGVGLSSVSPYNTNNDVLDAGSSNIYRVSIYSDVNGRPGIAWEVDYNSSFYSNKLDLGLGNISLATNALHPDICLVRDPGNSYVVHAITAWQVLTSGGNAWEIEDFIWNGSAFVSVNLTAIANGNAVSTVNIDGDDEGNFVITYDTNTDDVMCITGTLNNGMSLNSSVFTYDTDGINPDVCLYNDGGSNHKAYFTWIDPSTDHLKVSSCDFSDLASATPTPNTELDAINTYTFSFPRIACPNSGGPAGDWTVVVQDETRTISTVTDIIKGYNSNTGTTATIYNDGTYTSCDLTSTYNWFPVVTYDENDNVWVGWNFDNTNNAISCSGVRDAMYPLVVECGGQAQVLGSDYLEVPTSINSQDNIYCLSLSSKNSSELFLAYFDATTAVDVIHKWYSVASAPSGLRSPDDGNQLASIFSLNQEKNITDDEILVISYFDISGKLIYTQKGTRNEIINDFNNRAKSLVSSLYYFSIVTQTGWNYFSKSSILKY